MTLDASLISYVARYDKGLTELQRAGVTRDDFVDEYRTIWNYIIRIKRDHDTVPSPTVLKRRFPELRLPKVRPSDVPILLHDLRQRRKYITFLESLNDAVGEATNFENVDDAIQSLMGRLNAISFSKGESHLVDLFSEKARKKIIKEYKRRASGLVAGIPTGLNRFDNLAGGLQKQKMVTIIGRPGLGKSWLDLLFVANAVLNGHSVMLYPLEMTLYETAARLYTLFSQKMTRGRKVIKNYDITSGNYDTRKLIRFLISLEDAFAGKLYVADVSSLADPYTNERIEAEVDMHHPDMFWVDYLTLLKAPGQSGGSDDGWQQVRMLSNGIKNTAMRRDTVGGVSAQVNRSALTVRSFLPRLEHIAYGDSIGQDADQVFSINRKDKQSERDYLYYALVKNRGGPEIGKTRVKFHVNEGLLEEAPDETDDED